MFEFSTENYQILNEILQLLKIWCLRIFYVFNEKFDFLRHPRRHVTEYKREIPGIDQGLNN